MGSSTRHQSVREMELSRKLARVLAVLPFEVVLKLQEAIIAQVKLSKDGFPFEEEDFEVSTEIQADRKGRKAKGEHRSQDRLDVVIPSIPEVIFELKLVTDNPKQLLSYADIECRKNAVVVSIAKSNKPDEKVNSHSRIVQLTWENLFWTLIDLLGIDSKHRLVGDEKQNRVNNLRLNLPEEPLGEIASLHLEGFLRDLKHKNLVRVNQQRVMVVPGDWAEKTTTEKDIYFFGRNWNRDFDYVCVVNKKTLKYIGKVVLIGEAEIYQDDAKTVDDQLEKEFQFSKEDIKKVVELLRNPDSKVDKYVTVATLVPISPEQDALWLDVRFGDKYQGKGAIAQGHMYFENPGQFINHFKQNNN